jgi:hypothetical protein
MHVRRKTFSLHGFLGSSEIPLDGSSKFTLQEDRILIKVVRKNNVCDTAPNDRFGHAVQSSIATVPGKARSLGSRYLCTGAESACV